MRYHSFQQQTSNKVYLFIISVVAAGSLSCSQQTSQQTSKLPALPKDTSETQESQAPPATQTTAEPVFPSHLKQVCQGKPVAETASYQTSEQTTHPTYLVYREAPTDSYSDQSDLGLLPGDWEKEWRKLHEIELVLCVDRLQQQPIRKCEFKETGHPTYILEMYNTLYSVELREAKTGAVVAYDELAVNAEASCPNMHMFTAGETLDRLDADYTQAVYNFAKPYVETP